MSENSNQNGRATDVYDEDIAYLKANPDMLNRAWSNPYNNQGGSLFQFLVKKFKSHYSGLSSFQQGFGCPTMIKGGIDGREFVSESVSITTKILADNRIPENNNSITVNDLEVFAYYQRECDKELDRPTFTTYDELKTYYAE